ncbi:DUF2834 domain-containing protein [Ideonella livida]|uniref:DUF2834 domain-containing protein n=1 Tax=Ideonella livida TaxID=2707176 RepID=A0A7C9TNF8_9BURK|nr:DUF2834 domain-containing protein [Ideonella livida]NDY93783.1 DUF2834 domain-containing protein [Ideonella livida]
MNTTTSSPSDPRGAPALHAQSSRPLQRLQHPVWRAALWLVLGLGAVLPGWQYAVYLAQGGSLAPGPFAAAVSANGLTLGFTLDAYLSGLGFAVLVAADRTAGPRRWWAVLVCFAVGLAVALPGYGLWRGRASTAV